MLSGGYFRPVWAEHWTVNKFRVGANYKDMITITKL